MFRLYQANVEILWMRAVEIVEMRDAPQLKGQALWQPGPHAIRL
jgi:hypothetical protein